MRIVTQIGGIPLSEESVDDLLRFLASAFLKAKLDLEKRKALAEKILGGEEVLIVSQPDLKQGMVVKIRPYRSLLGLPDEIELELEGPGTRIKDHIVDPLLG